MTCLTLVNAGCWAPIATLWSSCWNKYIQKQACQLSPEKRGFIDSKIDELSKKFLIDRRVELKEIDGLTTGLQALGNAALPFRLGIGINPVMASELSEAELEFLIAHELSHIKANDLLVIGAVSGLIGVIAALAAIIIFPASATSFSLTVSLLTQVASPAALVGITVSFIALVFLSRWREECADKLAFSICSKEAQKAAPKFFERIKRLQIEFRNSEEGSPLSKLWRRFEINEHGDCRFDIFHPSHETRINYLRPKDSPLACNQA